MLNDDLLLANGYKSYNDSLYNADYLFQKRIRDDDGKTKYFIDIYKYVFAFRDFVPDYEVRLVTSKDRYDLNILIYCIRDMTLEDIENEVESIWRKLECKYYKE